MLVAKVCILLKSNGILDNERALSALVLMLRMKGDEIERVWDSHGNKVTDLLVKLIGTGCEPFCSLALDMVPRINKLSTEQIIRLCVALTKERRLDGRMIDALLHILEGLCELGMTEYGARAINFVWRAFVRELSELKLAKSVVEEGGKADLLGKLLKSLIVEREDVSSTTLHESIFRILERHAWWTFTSDAQWYAPMINWLSKSTTEFPSESIRQAWHGLVFTATQDHHSNLVSTFGRQTEVSRNLVRLLLSNLGNSTSPLRSSAWKTVATLASFFGWEWMNAKPSSRLGTLAHMCTLTRIAVGDLRIEMGNIMNGLKPNQTLLETIDAEAAVIIKSFHKLISVAEVLEQTGAMSESPEALLHLRKSHMDCVSAIVEFYASKRAPLRNAAHILSCMFTELSVWDDLPPEITVEGALYAVHQASLEEPQVMLPCLRTIQLSAEGVEDRASKLIEFGLPYGDSNEATPL